MELIDFYAGTDAGNGGASGVLFVDKNPGTGYKGTYLKAGWFNGLQTELQTTIEASGQVLSDTDLGQLQKAIQVLSIPIGMPLPMSLSTDTVLDEFASNFIKLSKDLTTTGLYNENKLTGQSTITTNETKFYTSVIDDADSILYGQVVTLINSTANTTTTDTAIETFLGAGETAGTRLADRLQGHYHDPLSPNTSYSQIILGGALQTGTGFAASAASTTSDATTDTVNGTPRTGKTTRPVTVTVVYYMRIK